MYSNFSTGFLAFLILLFSPLLAFGQTEESETFQTSLLKSIAKDENLTQFHQLITDSKIPQKTDHQAYTVLAITNQGLDEAKKNQQFSDAQLQEVLLNHILVGKWDLKKLKSLIEKSGGKKLFKTLGKTQAYLYVQNEEVMFKTSTNKDVVLKEPKNISNFLIYSINQISLPLQ